MKKNYILFIVLFTLTTACHRQRLEQITPFARIKVKIDWSKSGINPALGVGQDYVHHVSFRFFPQDGGEPFEEYLETNVYEGEILVPMGKYTVMAMNESVQYDEKYWEDYLTFHEIDSYEDIYVRSLSYLKSTGRTKYSEAYTPPVDEFYVGSPNERFAKECHKLAIWTCDNLEVTPQMVEESNSQTKAGKEIPPYIIKMSQVHTDVKVKFKFKNIKSVYLVNVAATGFAKMKQLHAGKIRGEDPSTCFFRLQNRDLNPDNIHGTLDYTFRTLGRTAKDAKYTIELDVIFIDGTRHKPDVPLVFDISDEINNNEDAYIEIDIDDEIDLPVVTGDLEVEEWEDNENITLT